MSFEPHPNGMFALAAVLSVSLHVLSGIATASDAERVPDSNRTEQTAPGFLDPNEPYRGMIGWDREPDTMRREAIFGELLQQEERKEREKKLAETLVSLDLFWGGGDATRWNGSISVVGGSVTHVTPLGWEADCVGAFYRDKEILHFEQRSAKRLDGFRFAIDAPISASLSLKFESDTPAGSVEKTIPLHRLLALRDSRTHRESLDSSGNRFEIRRTAGDEILVTPLKGSLVFEPGETTELEIRPRLFFPVEQKELFLEVVLRASGGEIVPLPAPQESTFSISNQKNHPFVMRLPYEAGVYDLEFAVKTRGKPNSRMMRPPFFREREPDGQTLAERTVQCVVVDTVTGRRRPKGGISDLETELVAQIDPTRSDWWADWAQTHRAFASLILHSWKNVSKSSGIPFSPSTPNPQIAARRESSDSWNSNAYRGSEANGRGSRNSWEKMRDFPKKLISLGEKNTEQSISSLQSSLHSSLNLSNLFDLKKEKEYEKSPPPRHQERFSPEFLGRIVRETWTEGPLTTQSTSLGSFVKLPATRKPDAVPWAMYPIPIREPNRPHVLEVEYLSDHPQTLGVSVLEIAEAGRVKPLAVHGGVDLDEGYLRETSPAEIRTYRVVFWPQTELPIVLLANRQTERAAFFGTIRLRRVVSESPRRFSDAGERLFAAYVHRPCFPGVFSRQDSPFGPDPSFFRAAQNSLHEPFESLYDALPEPTDWNVFRETAEQWIDSLHRVGYGGVMLNVAADGSALYPSEVFGTNPRFDSGMLRNRGEDPVRKDILELIARMCDREDLVLIPAIDFNAPLPALEERIRLEKHARPRRFRENETETKRDGETPPGNDNDNDEGRIGAQSSFEREFAGKSGYFWVDPQGRVLRERDRGEHDRENRAGASGETASGPARYNILHPHVQEEMLHAVREILVRYGKHPGFGGVALQLSPQGFAQVPGEFWGLDDGTFSRFLEETNLSLPENDGEDRFMKRYDFLKSGHRDAWIRWRAKKTSELYLRMSRMIAYFRPDAKLYLAGAELLDGPGTRNAFYPRFVRRETVSEHLLTLGFDLALLGQEDSLVFLRPEQIPASVPTGGQVAQWEMEQADSLIVFSRFLGGAGSLFYHENDSRTLASFERKKPDPSNGPERFDYQIVPDGATNRRRFVRQMAKADQGCFFEGGRALTCSGEDSLARFVAAYRRLPRIPFRTFEPNTRAASTANAAPSIQPVVVRYGNTESGTFLYVLNEAPFRVETSIVLGENVPNENRSDRSGERSGLKLTDLSDNESFTLPPRPSEADVKRSSHGGGIATEHIAEQRMENTYSWERSLEPYDFVAVRIEDARFAPVAVEVKCPDEICGEKGSLSRMRNTLVYAVQSSFEWAKLHNPDFEPLPGPLQDSSQDSSRFSDIPGWSVIGDDAFSAELDRRITYRGEGNTSLKMQGTGRFGAVVSNTFESPPTGRLFVGFRFGLPKDAKTVPLRVTLTGRDRRTGYRYFRTVSVASRQSSGSLQDSYVADDVHWHHARIPFTHLPLEGLEHLALRLELTEPGTVWVDALRMDFIAFTESERRTMMQMLTAAGYRQMQGNYSDAIALLEGFWPRIILDILSTRMRERDYTVGENTSPPRKSPVSRANANRSVPKPTKKKTSEFFEKLKSILP